MFPSRCTNSPVIKHQAGFLMPLAIFILVGASVLAVAISRLMTQASDASFREAISAQAFYAAESSAELMLHQILYPAADKTIATNQCSSINNTSIDLLNCTAQLTCSDSQSADSTINYYTVTSAVSCGAGSLLSERSIEMTAFLQ